MAEAATPNTVNGQAPTGQPVFSATYTSPTNEDFSVTHTLDAPPTTTENPSPSEIESRRKYLHALRQAVRSTQEEINKQLTARMEEDKAREGSTGKNAIDEAKEEENYGEENVEEEE